MINRVYEDFSKTEYRTIIKTRHETKKILVDPEHNVCGRCGRSYQIGENKRNINECPFCVCQKCGRSLSHRPRGHRLCGYCWGMGTEGYSYSFPTKTVSARYETRTVEINEEVQEPYTVAGKRLINPAEFEFDYKYAIKKINLSNKRDVFNSEIQQAGEQYYDSDPWWLGNKNCLKTFSQEKKVKLTKVEYNELNDWDFDEIITDEEQMREENLSVVGFYPNVPAYIQGYPLNMYNIKRWNERTIEKSINLYINLAIDSKFTAKEYQNRGILFLGLINYFNKLGVMVSIHVTDCSFVENEVLVVSLDFPELQEDIDFLSYVISDISFERCQMLGFKASLIKTGQISSAYELGFGTQISDESLRKVLQLSYNDILINDISTLLIDGNDLIEDCRRGLDSIGLANVNSTINKATEIEDTINKDRIQIQHTGRIVNKINLISDEKKPIQRMNNTNIQEAVNSDSFTEVQKQGDIGLIHEYVVGSKIQHKIHGEGLIIDFTDGQNAVVKFKDKTKSINIQFCIEEGIII